MENLTMNLLVDLLLLIKVILYANTTIYDNHVYEIYYRSGKTWIALSAKENFCKFYNQMRCKICKSLKKTIYIDWGKTKKQPAMTTVAMKELFNKYIDIYLLAVI